MRQGRKYVVHRCPRCLEMTDRKCYCPACLAVLKKPGRLVGRFHGLVTKWERRSGGWDATAFGLVVAVVLSLLVAGPARAADAWSRQDVALQATYAVLHVVDWGQTRYIAGHPEEFYEHNPILGRHPSEGEVNAYFAGTLVAHTLVTHFLPAKYRPWWQGVTIAVEGAAVGWNFNAGIKVDF